MRRRAGAGHRPPAGIGLPVVDRLGVSLSNHSASDSRRRVIAFCLYRGPDGQGFESYYTGLLRNAELAAQHFPGWRVHAWVADDVDDARLARAGIAVHKMPAAPGHGGMFWRLQAVGDFILYRDADSRLSEREADLVRAWEHSGKAVHLIHDHPHHASYPILGGMWGRRGEFMFDLPKDAAAMWAKLGRREDDCKRLAELVWPQAVQAGYLRHSSVHLPPHLGDYELIAKPAREFIGQQIVVRGGVEAPIWA